MTYINPQEFINEKTAKTLDNIQDRGHIYVSGVYKNRDSTLVVYCPKHDKKHSTTFYNYNRSRTGLPCCGDESRRELLTNRVFSPETIERMRVANSQRPNRGGQPRRWRENARYRNWRTDVLSSYNNCCAITGKMSDLVVHHLISAHSCYLLVYDPLNGIVLTKELHESFHSLYGYRMNTVDQFLNFLDSLLQKEELFTPISSQASWKQEEGSETRVDGPTRIMELQERVRKISKTLTQKLDQQALQ